MLIPLTHYGRQRCGQDVENKTSGSSDFQAHCRTVYMGASR